MIAGAAAAGLFAGIAFLVLFSIAKIPPHPILALSWKSYPDYYSSLLQIRIDGLKETHQVGETLDFAVAQKGGGCAYPEIIMIKDLEGTVIWEYNSTKANAALFCPIVTNVAEFEIAWHSTLAGPLSMNQTGAYAVVAKNGHLTVQKEFVVVG